MSASRKRRAKKGAAFGRSYAPPGTAPGTLTAYEAPAVVPKLRLIDYDAAAINDQTGVDVPTCKRSLADPTVTWVHVQGRVSPEQLKSLGQEFNLHPLAMEDVLNTVQRPKSDVFGAEFFAILALPRLTDELSIEQVSLFLGRNYVVSFHEGEVDPFEPVRTRIRADGSKLRSKGADYLFYALVDVVVDVGFPLLETLGDDVDDLEARLTAKPNAEILHEIHQLKRKLVLLRRYLWPQREVLGVFLRDERGFFSEDTRIYLRDCYDHSVQMMDLIETYREMASNLLDVYLSSVSNRLNEAMRFLTVISTIFIPLSFLVGVYGMNFDFMPELHLKWGYPVLWGLILSTAVGMLYFFKRREWL
ncbi:MAG: magnesium/cobalt transporter CorA [Myxococcota bacterium]